MPNEEENWHKWLNNDDRTKAEVKAIELRVKIEEEESKPIPSPTLRELRKEYSEIRPRAEHDKAGRILKLAEQKIEARTWEQPEIEDDIRMNIMHLRKAWLDGREQMIRASIRDPFDRDYIRKHWLGTSWRGRRSLAGAFVKFKASEFRVLARIRRARVIQEFRIWSVRFKWFR